ncbi:MAG: hypothetical protein CM1200mP10_11220 [Candidatus Neomarinimicrobiota bacterium]|nr:MAG: hypothetical protein CM1200mP10_11220 [Candidatus Neomarinimicrobiota bacterium]
MIVRNKNWYREKLFDEVHSDDPVQIIQECLATLKGRLIKDKIKTPG